MLYTRQAVLWLVLASILTISPGQARCQEVDRNFAQAHIGESIARVRAEMNSDPEIVQSELIDGLAKVVGDDPRVLALCGELVEKSTNPVSIRYALMAANIAHADFGAGSPVRFAKMIRRASERGNFNTRLDAAQFMSDLSPKYRDEGHRMFEHLLGQHPESSAKIIEQMIPTFGLTPEVINFYSDAVVKSTDTSAVQTALVGLRTVALSHKNDPDNAHGKKSVADYFRLALRSKHPSVQLNAAFYLSEMDGPYSNEARAFYEKRLRESFGNGEDTDQARWIAVFRIIRPILQADNPTDYPLLVDAARANDLISYYEKTAGDNSPINRINFEMIARWRSIVEKSQK